MAATFGREGGGSATFTRIPGSRGTHVGSEFASSGTPGRAGAAAGGPGRLLQERRGPAGRRHARRRRCRDPGPGRHHAGPDAGRHARHRGVGAGAGDVGGPAARSRLAGAAREPHVFPDRQQRGRVLPGPARQAAAGRHGEERADRPDALHADRRRAEHQPRGLPGSPAPDRADREGGRQGPGAAAPEGRRHQRRAERGHAYRAGNREAQEADRREGPAAGRAEEAGRTAGQGSRGRAPDRRAAGNRPRRGRPPGRRQARGRPARRGRRRG
ncbi:hypothetical protein BV378_02250, partial [Nostoc sp. RF31YmG]